MKKPKKKTLPFDLIKQKRKASLANGLFGHCKVKQGPLLEEYEDARLAFYVGGAAKNAKSAIFLFLVDKSGVPGPESIAVCTENQFKIDFEILQGAN